ncbi:MAG: aldehyde dehydrogenase family protein [Planctomycetes bacterium]|nr:aldehyde dehydrogenase family protein [Planctomycetota bacterium]
MIAVNPATEQVVREVANHSPQDVARRIETATFAWREWVRLTPAERGEKLRRAAHLLRSAKFRYARTITEEMGKPIAEAEAEIEKCAAACDHFAEHGPALLEPEAVATDASRSCVRRDPIGIVLAILPWNYPFWQAVRFAGGALLAGNAALVKPAPNVPGCALEVEDLFRRAGFPEGLLSLLLIQDVAAVIRHPTVRAVTLTGSARAGAAVAAVAGSALKKTVLELGGSDPFVVLADADVASAAEAAAAARCQNAGQSCIAAKRIVVEVPVAERFQEAFVAAMATRVPGDPMDRACRMGPLARLDLLEDLHRQVRSSIDAGARLLLGGERLARRGWFYPPTVLAGTRPGMAAFDEETFGPVAVLSVARDEEEAMALANATRYGLGASVWTADPERGEALAARLEAGSVFVNGIVKSDPRLPFGGVKDSGWGRELGAAGLLEFTSARAIWVK